MRTVILTIYILAIISLTSCDKYPDPPVCVRDTNHSLEVDLYLKCLDKASYARKGSNYSTNDDEDYDDIIYACQSPAFRVATTEKCSLVKKEGE